MYVYSCTRARSPILCTKVTYHPPVMNQRPELRPSISCAGRVDRWSRSGQRFETHTPSHERCLRVVARRAVEVRRIESSHASPLARPRAPACARARPRAPRAQWARRPSVKRHDALSCEPTLETTTPVKHARSESARPIKVRAAFMKACWQADLPLSVYCTTL